MTATTTGTPTTLGIDHIANNPYQPRKRFDADELRRLRDSITTHGVLQPVVVRKVGAGFQLIAGERRLRAAKDAGLGEIPVHVVEFNDQQVFEAALVENIHRADLNPVEKAVGFRDYLDRFKVTQDQLAAKLGLDRTTVSNLLGLLNLPPEVQDAVRLGQVSVGHAKVLKGVPDAEKQVQLCREAVMKGLSVHALEAAVKAAKNEVPAGAKPPAPKAEPVQKTAHVTGLETDLKQRLACRVEIRLKEKERGQIVIGFENGDDFERIVAALTK